MQRPYELTREVARAVDPTRAISLDELVEQPEPVQVVAEHPGGRVNGIVIGRLVGRSDATGALVAIDGGASAAPLRCRTLADLGDDAIGREVALMFEAGDPERPLVLGVVRDPKQVSDLVRPENEEVRHAPDVTPAEETLVLTAQKEIVLRCGRASLTLTRSGKVLIRGAYVSSRASGVNRVNGASVQIN
jgi:hypothetical protein